MQELDLLILGAGWTSTFLIPLCRERHISFAATTRDGRTVAGAETIKWSFDPSEASASGNQFSILPLATNILVTFPLTGHGQSKALVEGYSKVWKDKKVARDLRFVQLGSTGIWQIEQTSHWVSRHSRYDATNSRAVAEDELLGLDGSVLNLAGLWGGPRDPKNWVSRVAKSKQDVKSKTSLHMVHGLDVARAILAVFTSWHATKGQRWMLTDGFVYDWWALFAGWADVKPGEEDRDRINQDPAPTAKWVYELMSEESVQALPRSFEVLGRCYDSREFWSTFNLTPLKARI